jgi:phosphotransferase system HPr (HPr) family protein
MTKELTFPFNLTGRQAMYFTQNVQETLNNAIFLEKDNRRVNAKSLLGVLSLGITQGESIQISCNNEEEYRVMEEIINFVKEEL